ncbi:MAG: ABC transporter ATP-binding protein, partial [Candidatus Bathyarchaeia archaeon]
MAILEIANLTKTFGALRAVDNVSFDVKEGEIVGLIGPNGAGKTTLINVVTGLLKADSGSIKYKDINITNLPPHKICHLGISRTFQNPRPFPNMTAINNVLVAVLGGGKRRRMSLADAAALAVEYLEFVGLFGKRNILARDLSFYELRMLELARALATEPRLVFIDEVMAGLNPAEASKAVELIMKARDDYGLTIIWVEHVMRVIMEAAERV